MDENQVKSVDTKEVSKSTTFAKVIAAGTATTFVLAQSAHAAEPLPIPDMAPVIALIMGMVALVASIGMAVLSVYATGKVFKWVKAAF